MAKARPGQIVKLGEYNAVEHKTDVGSLPAPDSPSSVCIEIFADSLFESGDYWELENIVDRTSIEVDGEGRTHAGSAYDGTMLITMNDSNANEIGRVSGPYAFCVSAPLGPGLHRADIHFKKTSGIIREYSWTFEIIE
jgi:hypothetical protein